MFVTIEKLASEVPTLVAAIDISQSVTTCLSVATKRPSSVSGNNLVLKEIPTMF